MACKVDKIKLNRSQDRRAKFTDEQVAEMRNLYTKGCTQKAIAELYGTHQSTVSYIVSELAHENLAKYRKEHPPKRRTKEKMRLYMRDLRSYKSTIHQRRKGRGRMTKTCTVCGCPYVGASCPNCGSKEVEEED